MPTDNTEWIDIVPTGARSILFAYKYRREIQRYWKKAQVLVGLGETNIAVCGRPGTGKSVLISHCHGEANSLDWVLPDTSTDEEILPIMIGDWTKIVSAIPGQDTLERAKSLDRCLNQSDGLEGMIYIVDWGYTSIRSSMVRNEMIEKEKIETIDDLRNKNLEEELNEFKLMIDKVKMSNSNGRGPKWFILGVNKVDLFEADLDIARQYYHPNGDGDFSIIFRDLLQTVGKNNLKVACIPVCSMAEPYEWNGVKISSQIDSNMHQRSYLRNFIDQIASVQN